MATKRPRPSKRAGGAAPVDPRGARAMATSTGTTSPRAADRERAVRTWSAIGRARDDRPRGAAKRGKKRR